MKKKIIVLIAITMLILSACSNSDDVSKENLPINHLAGSFSIDVENLNEIVGDADYVFVAKVNEEVETIYKNKVTIETEDGAKEVSDPYTKYSVTVIDNIKGKLKKSKEINILKAGGITQDKESVVLYHDDELFQVGKYYIMATYAQPDGTLLVTGPNSSKAVDGTNKSEIVSSKKYAEYKKAFQNQIVTDRKRFKSKDEE